MPPGPDRALGRAKRRPTRRVRAGDLGAQHGPFRRGVRHIGLGVDAEELERATGADAVVRREAARLLRRDLGKDRFLGIERGQRLGRGRVERERFVVREQLLRAGRWTRRADARARDVDRLGEAQP